MDANRRRLIRKGATAALLAISLILILTIARNAGLVEKLYSEGLYRLVRNLVPPVFNAMPFSFGDLVYLFLSGWLLWYAGRLIVALVKGRFPYAGMLILNLLITAEALTITFYLMWGLNYFRPSAAVRLELTDSVFSKAELLEVTSLLIDSANRIRKDLPASAPTMDNEAILQYSLQAVRKLAGSSNGFRPIRPKVKVSLISAPVSYLGTAGYFNPFTSEAQINGIMPDWLKPLTACHEMAHQMGFGREDEANFVGFLAARDSPVPLIKYSAYYMAAEEFLFDVMLRDTVAYRQLRSRISAPVLRDYANDRQFWLSYSGAAGRMSSIFYNNYLKFNNQPEGLRTYNRMVGLTLAWYRKTSGALGKRPAPAAGRPPAFP
ncbi:MAG TPA: DUF3810 domain-containing protein [Sphingobacteriaceae bacterium]